MYAIQPLDPAAARRFEPLAPFEIRPVLRGVGALSSVAAFGATLLERPVGLIVVAEESDRWREATEPSETRARLLALTVARSYRRIGIGRALLAAARTRLRERGTDTLSCAYSFDTRDATDAAEAFFRATGWSDPETTIVHCAANESFMSAPLLRDLPPLPSDYEICDWVDLGEDERASIAERQRATEWYPPALDPFHYEAGLEPVNSLALRYQGTVVGWLLTHRTSAKTMYYRCLFVRDDLARLGRGLSLLVEAINRHWDDIGHQPGLGEWSTPATLPRMIRFIRRHLEPHGAIVREQRRVRSTVRANTPDSASGPRAPHTTGNRNRLLEVRHAVVASGDELARIADTVRELRTQWHQRRDSQGFHTLGAAAHLDALDDIDEYEGIAARDNAVLRGRFPALYDRLLATLTTALGAPATYHDTWALPGFRIAHHQRGAWLPLAPITCDVHHLAMSATPLASDECVSFSLCVTSPARDAGFRLWALTHEDAIGLDSEEIARLLDRAAAERQVHVAESLLIRRADVYAQRLPLPRESAQREVITLEGHAFRDDSVWRVYW